MAVIHKGKCDPRKKLRRTAVLLTLCWPVALCALALTAAFYWLGWERLLSLAQGWRRGFMAWALQPGAGVDGTQEWLQTLWHAAETALTGVGWGLYGLTLALPGLLGLGLAALLIGLFRPALREYRSLRAKTQAVTAALKLLAPLPGSCHIFRHKRIVLEDAAMQTELILVGPGGVMVMEVRGETGLIEGCVTDAVLRRRCPNGDVEKLRNPARPAVAGALRLTQLLQRQGIHVHVQPCVLFVSEAASVYVQPPEMLESGGRRARISACVMTDATSFWDQLGRSYASGQALTHTAVEAIVTAIRKAPEGRIRG